MREFTSAERRQLIDCEQVFAAWRHAGHELDARFKGSMSWKKVNGKNYLYRKNTDIWKGLGPESDATWLMYRKFHDGRDELKSRMASLDVEIRTHAKILKAMDLGRVPLVTARLLRRLDQTGTLGKGLMVAGTNALFAYERMAGVHFGGDISTTLDVDLLYDARGGLDLVASGLAETGLIGMLQKIDPSFALTAENSFRAFNDKGFMVDLITPSTRNPATRAFRKQLGDDPGDLNATEIEGLTWLESSPSVEVVAIDERGFPLMIVAPDPRAFVCHKLWVSARKDRDPLKRYRDREQAIAVCEALVLHRPDLRFDDVALQGLPAEVRNKGVQLASGLRSGSRQGHAIGDWA